MDNYSIHTKHDHNNFIHKLCTEKLLNKNYEIDKNLDINHSTHAIVFDDGEEFLDELDILKTLSIPTRLIKIKITRVINIKRNEEYKSLTNSEKYEYIGRGAKWGNPYSMFEDGDDRDEVIRKFKYDFDFDKFPHIKKEEVYMLAGKRLGCFCKPANCHGDILADYLNSWDDGE